MAALRGGGRRQDGGVPEHFEGSLTETLTRLLARKPVTPLEVSSCSSSQTIVPRSRQTWLPAGWCARVAWRACWVDGAVRGCGRFGPAWACGGCGRVAGVAGSGRVARRTCCCRICVWRAVAMSAVVIGAALLSMGREGYRRAGERLGVPGETVRDWRRRFRARAELIARALSAVGAGAGRHVGSAGRAGVAGG